MKKKRLLSLTLAAAMLFGSAAMLPEGAFDNPTSIMASAEGETSGQCGDNVFWSLDDEGVLTISGSGKMYDYDYHNRSPFYDRNDITSIVIASGVTSIGNYAFYGCDSLTSVIIPNSVTSIGDRAFTACKKLSSVVIPDSVSIIPEGAFNGCYNLETVVLPDTISSIGIGAFVGCKFKSINIPSGVKRIDNSVFAECTNLESIVLPDGITSIGTFAFTNCKKINNITLPSSVSYVEGGAFKGCSSLRSITVGSNIEIMINEDYDYYSPFEGCDMLNNLIISNNISNFSGDFYSELCPYITSLTLGSSVKSFDSVVYSQLSKITEISVAPDNHYYSSTDGVLYNKDKTKLIKFPKAKTTLNMPETVVSIDPDAFKGSKLIETVKSGNDTFFILNGILISANTKSSIVTIPNTVKSIGGGAFSNCSTVKAVTIPNSVVSIGNNAFENCTNLASITIPNSVKTIGEYAFKGCTNLASVSIPNSVTEIGEGAFYLCGKLSSIAIPKSVSCINPYTFSYCSSLSNVSIGSGVKSIGDGAFQNNTSLKTINIPDSVESIGEMSFMWSGLTSVTIPGSVKTIGKGAFNQSYSLNKVVISDGVETIGERAFTGIEKLVDTTTELPASVKSLGEYAFVCRLNVSKNNKYLCSIDGVVYDKAKTKIILIPTTIESIVLPDTITSIDMSMLKTYCTNLKLTKITLGKGITSIFDEQFKGFDKLTSITLADTVTSIGNGAFEDCKNLQSINIPESVATIGDGAFMNCSSLKSIAVPDAVDNIGTYTFYFCSALEKLTIGSGVKNIGDGAFSHCSKLTSLTIGDGVETIGQYAFDGCSSMTSLCLPDGLKSIGYGAFISCSNLKDVTIPSSVEDMGGYSMGYVESSVKSANVSINSSGIRSVMKSVFAGNVSSSLYTKVKDFDIGCCKNSAGEKYAIDNGFKCSIVLPNTRFAGTNRFSTAAKISKNSELFEKTDTVILAYGLNSADALAGVPLATKLKSPILLTNKDVLPFETLNEIKRLGAKNVIILGGEGAVSDKVKKELESNGLKTRRIAGKTRFGTATAIAQELNTAPEEIFFVYAFNFADALSVSTVAAAKNAPVIYLKTKGDIDADTAKYLKSIKGKVKRAYVIGGTGVIDDKMMQSAGKALGVTATRVAGKNRYATCTEINKKFSNVLTGKSVCVAKGLDFPDALAGGVFAALKKSPLFLADNLLNEDQTKYLKGKKPDSLYIFGGIGAVPNKIVKSVSSASV